MPRVVVPITDIVRSGATPPAQVDADATNKHYFTGNDGRVYLEIVSSDGAQQTVTVKAAPTFTADGLTVGDLVITIPAGATRRAGPFRVSTFKQNASADVYFDPSVSTTLKFRAWRLPLPSSS
jgi:hypothetical protein